MSSLSRLTWRSSWRRTQTSPNLGYTNYMAYSSIQEICMEVIILHSSSQMTTPDGSSLTMTV